MAKFFIIATLAFAATCGVLFFAPVRELMARAEGFVVLIDDPVRHAAVDVTSPAEIIFRFTNVTSEEVNIVGVETGCGCTSVEPIPVAIRPLGSKDVTCTFNMGGRARGTTYHAEPRFFLDRPSPEVRVVVDLELQ